MQQVQPWGWRQGFEKRGPLTREYSGNIRVQGRGWVPWAADPLRLLWAAVPPRTFGDILVPRTLGLLPLLKGPSQPTCQLAWLAVNMAAGGCGSGWVNLSHYLILASCLQREQHLAGIFLQQSLGLWRSSLAPNQRPAAGLAGL